MTTNKTPKPISIDALFQDEVWPSRTTGKTTALADMHAKYAANVLGILERDAVSLYSHYLLDEAIRNGYGRVDIPSDDVANLWVIASPLYSALYDIANPHVHTVDIHDIGSAHQTGEPQSRCTQCNVVLTGSTLFVPASTLSAA